MTTHFEDRVLNNIATNNGVQTDMERSILRSISDEYSKCDITRQDVDNWSKNKSLLPRVIDRFKATGKERLYDITYKSGSQSVHGNWETLSKNYLDYDAQTGRFKPDLSDNHIDIRLLNPQLMIVMEVMQLFLKEYEGHDLDKADIEVLKHLIITVGQLEDEHEEFLARVSW